MKKPSVRIHIKPFRTLLSSPVLPQWISAASIIVLSGSRQQCTCLKTVWKKTELVCVWQEKGTARHVAWVECIAAQTRWCIQWQGLYATLCELLFAYRKALWATGWTKLLWTSHSWQVIRVFNDCKGWRRGVPFCMPRFPALRFPHCSGEARNGKDASNKMCNNPSILHICWAWSSAACAGRMGKKLPFGLLYLFQSISIVFKDAIYFAYGATFPLSLKIHITPMMLMIIMS